MPTGFEAVMLACLGTAAAGLVAAAFGLRLRERAQAPQALGLTLGVLLGLVLLDVLPALWESHTEPVLLAGLLAVALLLARVLDRFCRCADRPPAGRRDGDLARSAEGHTHAGCTRADGAGRFGKPDSPVSGSVGPADAVTARSASPGRVAAVLVLGDVLHSLVDGALIAAAFAAGPSTALVLTVAIAVHEVPRRLATVALLLQSGRTAGQVWAASALAAGGTLLGGALAWSWESSAVHGLPLALAASAAALLCVVGAQARVLLRAVQALRRRGQSAWALGGPMLAGVLAVGLLRIVFEHGH